MNTFAISQTFVISLNTVKIQNTKFKVCKQYWFLAPDGVFIHAGAR